MRKRAVTFLFLGALLMITASGTLKIMSSGAPIGSTGAPGENTCAKAGCHTGNNLNAGTGILQVDIPELHDGNYVPGKTYKVTVSMQQNNIKRFGFALSVINAKDLSSGQLLVNDSQRTQVFKGSNQFTGRDYMTYKALGTNPYSEGRGQWSFNWKAPEKDEGPVTFYVAAVSANNDGTDEGDEVYAYSLTSGSSPVTGIHTATSNKMEVYPNPVKDKFTVAFYSNSNMPASIILYSIKGNSSFTLWNDVLPEGYQKLSFERPKTASPGLYLLQIRQGSMVFNQKLRIDQ